MPRILLIDSYDSFTYNLASLCKRAIPSSFVHIIKNDVLSAKSLFPLLRHFDAVIIGPGPGSPDIQDDIGVVRDIWHVADDLLIPVFGVCLGLQSLAIEHGAEIRRLNVVKHGQVYRIDHIDTDIFQDVGTVQAVRYHSLHVDLAGAPDIVPLAWSDDGEENGQVVMGLKHRKKPFWAVQYHPESVCTHGGGDDVLRNFWRLATEWSSAHGRATLPWNPSIGAAIGPDWPSIRPEAIAHVDEPWKPVVTQTVQLPNPSVPRICEMLGVEDDSTDFVMLDSAAAPGRFSIIGCLTPTSPRITYAVGDQAVQVRRGSDVTSKPLGALDIWAWLTAFMRTRKAHGGLPDVPFWGGLVGYLSYEIGSQTLSPLPPRPGSQNQHPDVNLVFVERSIVLDLQASVAHVQTILPDDDDWLEETVRKLQTFSSPATDRSARPPSKPSEVNGAAPAPVVTLPARDSYIDKIIAAKEWLFSGDSYELCVTAPTRVLAPKVATAVSRGTSSSWELYKILRSRNPAPHSGYVRLHPSTLLSSSPERFLSYSRPPDGVCQLRPIKGTVRKAPGITRAVAEEMLAGSTKEVAENLMIVDLIRHDLHSVVGEDVHVKQFCKVEEYETVWQLVSVIEGRPDKSLSEKSHADLGWEVLRASLPPGSMTGAPKKRSVEILRQLEGADRGIYSGVVGYADVGGGGDWAVIIRSCFKYDENPTAPPSAEQSNGVKNGHSRHTSATNGTYPANGGGMPPSTFYENSTLNGAVLTNSPLTDEWTLGAGGAITALSDPVAEWEEMITKVESVLRAFVDLGSS
ncbi:para-aminobenzoate synthase [Lentinus tigrinus ALCF2SS1-7]|uniref:para-aminobenzoate synthase n=1 Tax=Lentinus tigrinus ALCF2SS1-7 TaxID=1328758 RepID=UPI0011661BA8|nr:para-aminobenzoate synthase [Lentinus tigrinus ALCF2SS1-7]